MGKYKWMAFGLLVTGLVLLWLAHGTSGAWSQPEPAVGQMPAQASDAFDSGWVEVATDTARVFTHNLGGDPAWYAVDLWFRDTRSPGLGIHHRAYGGMDVGAQQYGAHWQNLTDAGIVVLRHRDDVAAGQVRLRIWQPDPPDYDSGWVDIQPGRAITLTHNLGGDVDGYTVGMKFRDAPGGERGLHQFAFGGLEAGGAAYGAAWQRLTDTTIQVLRFGDDTSVQQVRVFITQPDPPDYDSDWVDVAQGQTRTITHNLGGNSNGYVVRGEVRSTVAGGPGINARAAGGLEVAGQLFGSNWQNLTATSIDIFRQPHDVFADQVRIRIWRPEARVYLPLVTRNYPPVPTEELTYDDGQAESSQSYTTGNGFAVRFTPPGGAGRLVRARYFFVAPVAPIEVHVWDAGRNDLATPFTATPSGDGWFDVDLSSLNLTVSGDFYVGFLHTVDTDPTLGVDTSAPDGRSYEVPWEAVGYDYMIRAVVQRQEGSFASVVSVSP